MKYFSRLLFFTLLFYFSFGKQDGAVNNLQSLSTPTECKQNEALERLNSNNEQAFKKIIELFQSVNSSIMDVQHRIAGLESEVGFLRRSRAKQWQESQGCDYTFDQPIFDAILSRPTARLFMEENFTGTYEDYTFEKTKYKGGCHDLIELWGRVKSVEPRDKCVRLFYDDGCDGWSLAIYPGSENSHNVFAKMQAVRSVGPCLANEFQSAYFKDLTKRTVSKNSSDIKRYVPDLLEISSDDKFRISESLPQSNYSLTDYLLGPNDRIELLRALIYPNHLNMSQPLVRMEDTAFFKSLDKEDGDVAGYGIPTDLGGPVNEVFNVFPQSPTSRDEWNQVTSAIHQHFYKYPGSDENVLVLLNFEYENINASRPYAFNYWVAFYESSNKRFYGRVFN